MHRSRSPKLHVMLAEFIYSESPEVVGLNSKNVGFKKYLVVLLISHVWAIYIYIYFFFFLPFCESNYEPTVYY